MPILPPSVITPLVPEVRFKKSGSPSWTYFEPRRPRHSLTIVLKLHTIVLIVSTEQYQVDLSAALFGKTRRAVLGLLFSHADEAFYLRRIARESGSSLGAVQREVKRLANAGIILRTVMGHQVFYQANRDGPIFAELKGLVMKTVGLVEVLRSALMPAIPQVHFALIHGSLVRGEETRGSDVDLLVVGEATFGDIVAALNPAQETLQREVNPTVYPPIEFEAKVRDGHHFLKSVFSREHIYLTGRDHGLAQLAEERLADRAQVTLPGDQRTTGRRRSGSR